MGYELNKLMKQYGVSSFTLPQYSGVKAPSDTVIPGTKAKSDVLLTSLPGTDTKTPVKYYTAPVAPTTPVMPTMPAAFAGTTPIAPAKLGKGATAEQTAEYNVSNAQYLADLNKFKADQDAAKTAQTTYNASLKSYPDLMKTYNTDLTKFNTDKTTWDELQRKYDLDQNAYNSYVADYKDRMANTPQRLSSEFVQGKSLTQSRPNTSMGQTTLPENNIAPVNQPSLSNADISSWAKQNPYATNQNLQDYQKTSGVTNQDLYNATGSYYGNQLNPPSYGSLSNNFNNLTPQQQADQYAQQRNVGYTDADIKGKFAKQFGSPTDTNWTAMQNLAFPTSLPVSKNVFNTDYTYAPSSQQQLENQAINAGYQGDYTDTNAMQEYLNSQYAKGGSVHHLARKYAVGGGPVPQGGQSIVASAMPNPEAGIPQPTPAPVAVQAPPSDNMEKMQEMLQAYGTPTNDYAQELEEARRKSNAENEAFMDMFKKARQPENDNLSQAELFFRLAAAAGAPTKTGGITESLSNINREMADYSKEQTGRRNSDLELQMKAQQLKAANAKEDLNTLRGLAGESMKDKRAIISEMIKAEIPKAQSEAGKLALDMGLKVGTPEYQQFVTNNGMQLLQAKVNQMVMGPAIATQNAATSSLQAGISGGQLDVARDRYNLSEKEYQDKMSGVIPPVELRKMEKDASKDLQTVENAAKQVNLIKNDVNALKTHPGLSGITGMSGNIYKYPGSERAQAQTALESLQNKLEGFGKVAQSASGAIGAMAVAEWKKMRDQIATIDPVKLGEQGTIKALGNLNDDLDASVSMLKSQYEREHSTILERNPNKFQLKLNFGQKVNDEASAKQAGWVLHQDANGNKAYINPANKSEHLEIQ
jgi:hypothetical protein